MTYVQKTRNVLQNIKKKQKSPIPKNYTTYSKTPSFLSQSLNGTI